MKVMLIYKKLLFFNSIFFLLKLSSFSIQSKKFNPIPDGNGIYNSIYDHTQSDNLYFIFEHFRHGARSPCTLPKNNIDSLGGVWQGKGQLTTLGRKQHYEIGIKNRKRYSEFIDLKFDPKELICYSTDYRRTIMSAQSQLLGFYNQISYDKMTNFDVSNENLLNSNLNSVLPPIHLFEEIINRFNYTDYETTFHLKFKCKNLKKNIKKNDSEKNMKIQNILKDFNEKYSDILKKEYGISNTNTYKGLYNFCDDYICNYFNSKNYNNILKIEKYSKNLTEIVDICYNLYGVGFADIGEGGYASNNGIVTIGPTMKKIVFWMNKRIKNSKTYINYDSPKFVLHSSHDDILIAMQRFLNEAFNIEFEWVPFASVQLYELRKYGNDFYVEIYYNDHLRMNITFKEFEKRILDIALNDKDTYNQCYGFPFSLCYLNLRITVLTLTLIALIAAVLGKAYYTIFHRQSAKSPSTVQIV